MQYREERNDSKIYKEAYVGGFSRVLEERRKCAEIKRKAYAEGIFEHQAQYREAFKKMLGWPLVDYQKSGLPDVSMTKLSEEEGYSIYRVQFEILEGLTMTGLFFHADGDEKKPLVILQHGGGSAIGWKTVTTYVDSGSEISVNLPDDATYCYASITDNYGDIISTKFMKVQ